jgi:hypothetical protein
MISVPIESVPPKMLHSRFPEKMRSFPFQYLRSWLALVIIGLSGVALLGQTPPRSQEVSDDDGSPVLLKHLPNWETVKGQSVFAKDAAGLKPILGDRDLVNLIHFVPGTEAVAARYEAGTLLIVEFPTPQFSVDADTRIQEFLSATGENGQIVYRRIGNYNALVFDTPDAQAAAQLLDQVKYEKDVRWLGDNPFFGRRAERNFVITTSDIFLSTVFVIVLGIGISIVGGLFVGSAFFFLRERERAARTQFTDAGGMTRLNLDGFTPDISPVKLLED